ncbi:MAG: hypothetical protein FD165_1799 [Gammaproteobacteria bacterium]|nr:MAG: hypothetical protein FD165_1799 [Gammaproteobacteria bacterium]TND04372.1 MAG: hypothetical protein FD120_1486 [Gammaproteobacteria bacterium]
MAVMIGIMILLIVLGAGHLPMMGGHGMAGQTQGSVPPTVGEENCRQCPQQEKVKKGDETPAN